MRAAAISARTLLGALPLFKSLDRATLDRLAAATTRISVRRGERVFRHGSVLTGMYVLVYGQVRLVAQGRRGRRLSGVVQPGASFGEPTMFLQSPAAVDAEAVSDALVLHLPREAVFEELQQSPLFARRMIASLAERIQALVQESERHALPGGRQRIIQYLARNARPGPHGAEVALPAPKAVVASHLHLTPEHFSRLLHELKAEGLVQLDARRIAIPDLERLVAARGGASAEGRRAGEQ